MPNQNSSNNPSPDPQKQSVPESPMAPTTPQQHEMSEHSANRPDNEESKAIQIEKDIRSGERWLIGISAASVILNFVIALIYYGQLKEMRKSTKAAQDAAIAAKSAAETADSTLKSSEKSFVIDQRPYLVSQAPEFAELPTPNKEIYANETIKNVGRTPALKRITSISLTRFDAGSKTKLIRFLESEFKKMRVSNEAAAKQMKSYVATTIPDAEMDIAPQDSYFGTNQNSIKLSEEELKNLRDGKGITLFYVGLVNYRDSFGNSYETQFCYIYFGPYPKIWHICDSHNVIR